MATSSLVVPTTHTDYGVEFSPVGPGQYDCSIILRGADDVRVFKVEVCHDRVDCSALMCAAGVRELTRRSVAHDSFGDGKMHFQ